MPTNLIASMASKIESEPMEIPEALKSRAKKIMFLSNLGAIAISFCTIDYPFTSPVFNLFSIISSSIFPASEP